MSVPTFTITVPTIGRPTLARTLRSIHAQKLIDGDEIRVIRDDPPHKDWGMWCRKKGVELANATFLLFIDDDDCYTPGAIETIRKAVEIDPDRVHIFRMIRYEPFNDVIWNRRDLSEPGQVSTQMFAVPNRKEWLGEWGDRYEGDFDFLKSTLAKIGTRPVWHEEIIAEAYSVDLRK